MTDLRTAAQQALVEEALQRLTDVHQEMEEPPCATQECMPSKCPNCTGNATEDAHGVK